MLYCSFRFLTEHTQAHTPFYIIIIHHTLSTVYSRIGFHESRLLILLLSKFLMMAFSLSLAKCHHAKLTVF